MMSDLVIRACQVGDIETVTAIYRHAVLHGTGTFEIDAPDAGEMTARFKRIAARNDPFLVAVEEGIVVGYAYGSAFRDRPAFRFTVEDSIYVRHDKQGRGIGAVLLARLIGEAEARGFRQMIAVIGDSANVGSIALHRKFGFADLATMPAVGWKAGRWLDCVLMQRALGGWRSHRAGVTRTYFFTPVHGSSTMRVEPVGS